MCTNRKVSIAATNHPVEPIVRCTPEIIECGTALVSVTTSGVSLSRWSQVQGTEGGRVWLSKWTRIGARSTEFRLLQVSASEALRASLVRP